MPSGQVVCSTVGIRMADAAELRARAWEWDSVQGFLLVAGLCIGLPAALVLTWPRLSPLLVALYILLATLLPVLVGLPWGLAAIPRSISSTAGTVRLTFPRWHERSGTVEFRPEDLGHLKILSFGFFGSGLVYETGRGTRGSWSVALTRRQAQIFEGRVRRVTWLRG